LYKTTVGSVTASAVENLKAQAILVEEEQTEKVEDEDEQEEQDNTGRIRQHTSAHVSTRGHLASAAESQTATPEVNDKMDFGNVDLEISGAQGHSCASAGSISAAGSRRRAVHTSDPAGAVKDGTRETSTASESVGKEDTKDMRLVQQLVSQDIQVLC